jgi:hypothetical protein
VAAPEVLDEAGIALPDDDELVDEGDEDGPPTEGEVERFREFLEGVSPEDFGSPDPS